jgi:hypothetical protein
LCKIGDETGIESNAFHFSLVIVDVFHYTDYCRLFVEVTSDYFCIVTLWPGLENREYGRRDPSC